MFIYCGGDGKTWIPNCTKWPTRWKICSFYLIISILITEGRVGHWGDVWVCSNMSKTIAEMSKSVRHASKTDKICSCLTKITKILVRMSDGEVWGTQQSLTVKCPLVTWRQQKYFFFFFLYCAWLQSESLAHVFKAKELKSKPQTKSEADKALISQIELVQKDIETTFCNLHAVIKHNRPINESCIMLISIRSGIWWCFKKGVLRCKIYIWSGMFSFGLANFLFKFVRPNVWHAEKSFRQLCNSLRTNFRY